MAYKLIVTDLDDTLLNEKGALTEESVRAAEMARQAGAEWVLASGRMPCAMRPFIKPLGVTLPMIAYNGAQLVEPGTEKVVYSLPIAADLARELLAFCEGIGLHAQAYEGDEFLTPEDNELARYYEKALKGAARMRVTGQPLSRCVTWDQPKVLCVTDPARAPEQLNMIKERFGDRLVCAISRPQYIECTSPITGKERALEELCRQLEVAPEEVIAFGDGQNDIGMIRFAGLGCAPTNARQEVRDAADLVAPSNRENGVAQVIMKLLDEGKIGKGI